MTTPRTAAKRERDNRLFARLLVEEYERRKLAKKTAKVVFYGPLITSGFIGNSEFRYITYPPMDYLAFIRAQATYTKSSRGWCYALALKAITHG